MAFQESVDPLVEKLQYLIDDLRKNINYQEFEKILQSIDERFPFVNLLEFIEMYVDGEYSRNLIEKFHLSGYADYYKLLQILKLNKKRTALIKNSMSRNTNLSDTIFSERYYFLQDALSKFRDLINDRDSHNVLRAIIILYLFSNFENLTNKTQIIESLPKAIMDFEHLIQSPHQQLASLDNKKIESFVDSILLELKNNLFLEFNELDNFGLKKHYFQLFDYILNIIQNRKEGITYQELLITLKERLPILSQIPPTLIEITLHDLVTDNKIIKKEGYWKFKPFFDQYFTFDNYRKLSADSTYTRRKNREFFGRKITPEQFIEEIMDLGKGNFDDNDDQVTRIAGMILSNSNMMTLPPNEFDDFDFTVDLSKYNFTNEQQQVIKNLNLEIKSQIIYVKVMILEEITDHEVEHLISKLARKGLQQQGFIISFLGIPESVKNLLKHDKTIQIISKDALRKWCEITPIIPSRRGAVAIIRQGDNDGSIVKIKSVNYESGLADIILFPTMRNTTQYIGSLEEISLHVNPIKFVDSSNIYFQFLIKLFLISDTTAFKKIITNNHSMSSIMDFKDDFSIGYIFKNNLKTKMFLDNRLLNWKSLKYFTDDLFSCHCFQWSENSKSKGLCDHLIFTLNESIKQILSSNSNLSQNYVDRYLQNIENKMDVFLKRLRFSNKDGTVATCPNCGQVAVELLDVENTFGYRQMNKDDKFSLRRQSQCKKCRSL